MGTLTGRCDQRDPGSRANVTQDPRHSKQSGKDALRALAVEAGIYEDGAGLAVEAIVLTERDEIILLRRGPDARDEVGKIESPGGSVDDGSALENAIRECQEELGPDIVLAPVAFLGTRRATAIERTTGRPRTWIVASYEFRLIAGAPVSNEPRKGSVQTMAVEDWFSCDSGELSSSALASREQFRALRAGAAAPQGAAPGSRPS